MCLVMRRSSVRFRQAAQRLTSGNASQAPRTPPFVVRVVVRSGPSCAVWPRRARPRSAHVARSRRCRQARCGSRCTPGSIRSRRLACTYARPSSLGRQQSGRPKKSSLDSSARSTSAATRGRMRRCSSSSIAISQTRKNYRSQAEKHIIPCIGQRKVRAVDADISDSFYAELRQPWPAATGGWRTGARFRGEGPGVSSTCDPKSVTPAPPPQPSERRSQRPHRPHRSRLWLK